MAHAQASLRAQAFQRSQSKLVLAIEVGGKSKKSLGREPFERMTKDLIPNQGRIPEILVSEENDIEFFLGQLMRQRGIGHPEFDPTMRFPRAPPTLCCLGNFSGSEIEPKIPSAGFGPSKAFQQNARFIRPTTSEIEQRGLVQGGDGKQLHRLLNQSFQALRILGIACKRERQGGR